MMAGANGETPPYRPIAMGSTFREPHFEHRHRFHRAETSAQGLWRSISSSIGQVCLWPQPSQRTPMVAILRWCWSEASDTSQVSRDFSAMAP
jgi:hypothetical protein